MGLSPRGPREPDRFWPNLTIPDLPCFGRVWPVLVAYMAGIESLLLALQVAVSHLLSMFLRGSAFLASGPAGLNPKLLTWLAMLRLLESDPHCEYKLKPLTL